MNARDFLQKLKIEGRPGTFDLKGMVWEAVNDGAILSSFQENVVKNTLHALQSRANLEATVDEAEQRLLAMNIATFINTCR